MTAHLLGRVMVRDTSLWQQYVAGVTESLAGHGAKVLLRGHKSLALAGDDSHTQVVVIEFPDIATLQGWYYGDRYQALVPLRDRAADVVIIAYET
ncbi:DUF1330 domain-containing protein [Marinobacter salicampi]|uniref:DUF1330 domain-containing protein n=1 Tax=Marinobacter salicampi TaxID=435907 RepID=UPI00140ADD84|nr:DUF1330 domain-containing protein [Marinobacter salicampi]